MNNTMTAHEPINYLDSILSEEETRREYSHQRRNYTISRSGRFKSKNKQRHVVDGKTFDRTTTSGPATDPDKISTHQSSTSSSSKPFQPQSAITTTPISSTSRVRDKTETYKSYYETNL